MESWRKVWRTAIGPYLSTAGLEALRQALVTDDPRLIQHHTCEPVGLMCLQDFPVEKACALGYAAWQGDGLETVGEVSEAFAMRCLDIDNRLGEPAECRWFLNWFDDTPRDEMRRELLIEVLRSLAERPGLDAPTLPTTTELPLG